MKNLKINTLGKRKYKLLKKSFAGIVCSSLILLSGCSNIDTTDYYIVSKNNNYYLCERKYNSVNCNDYYYHSLFDGKELGCVCINGNNFDYEKHHITVNFLSTLQIVNLSDVIGNKKISKYKLKEITSSNTFDQLADDYFYNKPFPVKIKLDNNDHIDLKIFTINNKIIVGYDISPKRISNSMKYIYSITDLDTFKYKADEIVNNVNIDNSILLNDYITYNDAVDLINAYQKIYIKN